MTANDCINALRTLILDYAANPDDARHPGAILAEAISLIGEYDAANAELVIISRSAADFLEMLNHREPDD